VLNAGCGRCRWKVTSKSPLVVTSSRLRYHDLRGLRRSLSLDLPVSRSQVHLTSLAVKGLPSCHLTPSRNGKVSSVPSSLHDQPVARSGTIDCKLFLFYVLVEHDEVIEHRHHRPRRNRIHFLVHRQARRRVKGVHSQNTA